jgi:hypothetical protein
MIGKSLPTHVAKPSKIKRNNGCRSYSTQLRYFNLFADAFRVSDKDDNYKVKYALTS